MGAYTLLQDLTVSSNSTSVVLNNFGTITKDDFYKVEVTLVNSSSGTSVLRLFSSSNTTNSNYSFQQLTGNASTVSANRQNESRIADTTGSKTDFIVTQLKLSQNDRLNLFSLNYRELDTSAQAPRVSFIYTTSSGAGATFSSGITSLTFTASATNGIGSGSRIQIYRLDAVKIADITVTSNTTQVDISNLSIDKDSEYLLVSDITGAVGTHLVSLFPNDLTTATNYHMQQIQGDGSSANASRFNSALFQRGNSTENSIGYAHIKLSNIGAFTFQGYSIRAQGSSSMRINNHFTSSTAENITSITKLNLVSPNANTIGSGSRFILYKLYE